MKDKRFKLGPYTNVGVGGTKAAMDRAKSPNNRNKLSPYSFFGALFYTHMYEDRKTAIRKTILKPYYFSL